MGVEKIRDMKNTTGLRFKIVLLLIVLLWIFGLLAYINRDVEERNRPDEKYEIKVSNPIGHSFYYCDSYERADNTYKLFNYNNELIHEITITDCYLIEINLNERY